MWLFLCSFNNLFKTFLWLVFCWNVLGFFTLCHITEWSFPQLMYLKNCDRVRALSLSLVSHLCLHIILRFPESLRPESLKRFQCLVTHSSNRLLWIIILFFFFLAHRLFLQLLQTVYVWWPLKVEIKHTKKKPFTFQLYLDSKKKKKSLEDVV